MTRFLNQAEGDNAYYHTVTRPKCFSYQIMKYCVKWRAVENGAKLAFVALVMSHWKFFLRTLSIAISAPLRVH